jgi:hypothetical protein
MKKTFRKYLFLALIIALGACNNEPVFYMVSVEPPITDPLIGGSPANFVVFKGKVYVASGRNIYSFDGTSFEKIPSQPGGRIMQLAATDSYLYALCFPDSGNTNLKRASAAGNWEDVTGDTGGYNMLQSVYAATDKVFIGAERNSFFIILYMSDNDESYSPLTPGGTGNSPESMLCGMAYDSRYYYLCTRSNKFFLMPITGGSVTTISKMKDDDPAKDDDVRFTGIINLGSGTILAISRNGNLYNVTSADIARLTYTVDGKPQNISIGNSRYSTGALAVWRDETGTPKLLLAGRQDSLVYTVDSGYTYGYMELELDSGGIKTDSNFTEPGKAAVSSVADNERYISTIGKYPLNHIFQMPADIDPEMTLFASTQKNGVWSYKQRDSDKIWNAEE